MTELLGLYPEELREWLQARGEAAFRAKQLFGWLHRGVPFAEMSNLPLKLRELLPKEAVDCPVQVIRERTSRLDGTKKLLFSLRDGNCVEGVLMRYQYGITLCISTQVGCRMGCRFCASTLSGCIRGLSAAEMLGEVLAANGVLDGEQVHNIVLMGSGEPFDNYDNVVRFLRLAGHPEGLNISPRRISLSTCGLVPQILRFSGEGIPLTMSLSLHAPNDEIRRQIMPIAAKYTIRETLDACREYLRVSGRRIVLEYALIDGVNAGIEHARELAGLLRGLQCHVNVIPLNSVPERNLRGVNEQQVSAFLAELKRCRISATRRREMGDDIEGACGQLRRKYMEETEL